MPLLDNPPELDAWRQRLFRVDEPIHLTREQFRVYWPHVDNVWALQQRRDAVNFKRVMYRCRLAKKPNPPQKDPTKKMRNRARREKQCDSGLTMYQYPDGTTVLRRNQHEHAHDILKSDEIKKNSVQRNQLAKERIAKLSERRMEKSASAKANDEEDSDVTMDHNPEPELVLTNPPGYLKEFSSIPDDTSFSFGKMFAVLMLDMTGDVGDSLRTSEDGETWMRSSARWMTAVHSQEVRPLSIFTHLDESSLEQPSTGFTESPPASGPNQGQVNGASLPSNAAPMLTLGSSASPLPFSTEQFLAGQHMNVNVGSHSPSPQLGQPSLRFITQHIPAQKAQQKVPSQDLPHGHTILQSQMSHSHIASPSNHLPIQPRPGQQFNGAYSLSPQYRGSGSDAMSSFQAATPSSKRSPTDTIYGAKNLGTERPITHIFENFEPQKGHDIAIVRSPQYAGTGYELEPTLRQYGIDTVIISGLRTAGLVLMTVTHLLSLNYKIYVISDTCIETTDNGRAVDEATKQNIFPSLPVTVITLDQALGALRRSGPIAYKPVGIA